MPLAQTDVINQQEYNLLINNASIPAESGETLEIIDPATEAQIASVSAGGAEDVDKAVAAATQAQDAWANRSPSERGRLLFKIAERIRDNAERLATIETLDVGKPYSQAEGDTLRCARFFEYFAGLADKAHGRTVPTDEGHVSYTLREPIGVSAQISPWNFPVGMIGRSIAPALAAGNTVVHKPAELTPLTALEVAKLGVEAGLPEGVWNVVPGLGPTAGDRLSSHPKIGSLMFTGSTETGRMVAKNAVDNIVSPHLELGGKGPSAVFADADLENAVTETLKAIFVNAGQTCTAGSRLLVQEEIHEQFVERLIERTTELTIGPGIEDYDIGPLVSQTQLDRVTDYIDVGRVEAGDPLIGGTTLDRPGYFVEPTIFDNVDNETRIAQEEIFGPVLCVIEFSDEQEAIRIANDTDYGLSAAVFTDDIGRAHRYADKVQAGQIYINEFFAANIGAPHGGFKKSGIGREKGIEAMDEYTQTKNVTANIKPEYSESSVFGGDD